MGLESAQSLALWAAFWAAVLSFRRCASEPAGALRFVLALVCGAVFAHVGWALLHLPRVSRHPAILLDASRGFTLLTVPLGVLLAIPWRRSRGDRDRFLASALRALPLAFAVAKLGCLAAGCCRGLPMDRFWGVVSASTPPLHPTVLYEAAGFTLLHAALRHRSDAWVAPVFAFGFGAIRLSVEPLRAPPPLGEPAIPVAVLAAAWLIASLLLAGCVSFEATSRLRRRMRGLPRFEERVRVQERETVPGQQRV